MDLVPSTFTDKTLTFNIFHEIEIAVLIAQSIKEIWTLEKCICEIYTYQCYKKWFTNNGLYTDQLIRQ